MVRQCAWCLCLIDNKGERISPSPLPKLYEASHGICGVCGTEWMEQVVSEQHASQMYQASAAVTDLVFELQKPKKETPKIPVGKRKKLRMI